MGLSEGLTYFPQLYATEDVCAYVYALYTDSRETVRYYTLAYTYRHLLLHYNNNDV